jgi:hypothetical protein
MAVSLPRQVVGEGRRTNRLIKDAVEIKILLGSGALGSGPRSASSPGLTGERPPLPPAIAITSLILRISL